KFAITIAKVAAGKKISVTATDAAGNESAATEVIVKDVTPPAAPKSVFDVTQFDTFVMGTAEKGSTVEVKVNGILIGSGKADKNGYFDIDIPAQAVGTKLVITATDAAGNVSKGLEVTVIKAETGWFEIDKDLWIYISPTTGELVTGWLEVGGKKYFIDEEEYTMVTGWEKINGSWYYFAKSGAMQTGWAKVDNKWYFLNADGTMKTGWVKSANKWYYLSASGAMQTGWAKVSGKWYFLNTDGAMKTGWVKVSGKWYFLNTDGAMQSGWVKVSGKWYFLNTDGAMQTGWILVSKKWYFLYTDGHMAANTTIGKYKIGTDGAWIQ
ncbi:Ig-like domain-containing protein, partial [Neobacillus novalis]